MGGLTDEQMKSILQFVSLIEKANETLNDVINSKLWLRKKQPHDN